MYIQLCDHKMMTRRQYLSPVRDAAAAEKRSQIIAAATDTLAKGEISGFSLDAVARRAEVTRLTVYNQFGSRRGLLEAVFDERAERGGLHRLVDAMRVADPHEALDRIIGIFCDFWDFDPSLAKLQAATALDAEFGRALAERNERRRKLFTALIKRMAGEASTARRRNAVDLMFVLTSQPTYAALRKDRSKQAVCSLIREACTAAVEGLQRT
jgi:AcrR family transcriptional regulator